MAIAPYRYTPANYSGVSEGLGQLGQLVGSIEDRKRADLEKRDAQAQQSALADPLIRKSIERILSGEDPVAVAEDHLAQEHLSSLRPTSTGTGNSTNTSYGLGPNSGGRVVMRGGEPEPYSSGNGQRLNTTRGAMVDYSTLASGQDPGIQNQDVPTLMKLGGMIQSERKADSLADYRYGNLGLGYDKLDLQRQKASQVDEYRKAMSDYLNAKRLQLPEQMALAKQRAQIALGNLGLHEKSVDLAGRRLGLAENTAYVKNAGPALQTASQIDQLVNEAKSNPEVQIPDLDFQMQRSARIYEKFPIFGQALAEYTKLKADEKLTQSQLNFKRQKIQTLAAYIHDNYGSQLTGGELARADAIAGDQLSFADSIAGLQALGASLKAKASMWGQAIPGAAARIQAPNNILPNAGTQTYGQMPGLRIEQLTPQQRQQFGVSTQEELDYINRQTGREPVGSPSGSDGGLDMLNGLEDPEPYNPYDPGALNYGP